MSKREPAFIQAVEKVPLVGPIWADVLMIMLGLSDAMNLRGMREESLAGPPPRRAAPPAEAPAEEFRRVA